MAAFLRIWIGTLAGLMLLVVGLNLLVDPYDVFGTPRIRGISLLKPGAKNHALLAKTYQEARAHPVTVLIGSSSVHIGIDASAPDWDASMRPVYNYGIPGQYAATGLRTLQQAIAVGGVRNAVVFLDFQNFFAPDPPATGMSDDDRRFLTLADGAPNPHRRLQFVKDIFLSLTTMGALIDSVSTIAGQESPNLLNLAPDGSSNEADFINEARTDGMHDLFAQKEVYEIERAEGLKQIMAGWQGTLPDIDEVAAIIAFARARDVTLTLAIVPHHGDTLEIYWRMGLWPRVEQLKVELANLVAKQGGAVALWDFMDYSTFNTEPVPVAGDRRSATRWFWEPSHFKKQLGEIMIRNMFGRGEPAFGVRLTPENVADRNALVRQQRDVLVCDHMGTPLLTSVATPGPDGCTQTAVPRGPT